jgi:hypothetical protein
MKNIYYSIWVDAIVNIEKNPNHKKDWKFFSMVYMTLLNALNMGVVLMLLAYIFKFKVIWVSFTILPGTMLNSFAAFIVQFAIPLILLNYGLIFYKNRYRELIQRHSDRKGKLFALYLFSSIGLFITCVICYILLR